MTPLANRRLLSQDVFDVLCDELVDGTFPPGTQLDVDHLADRFGVSRTPVREALGRLIRAGLVESSPNRYTRVSERIDDDTVRSLRILHSTLDLRLQEDRITPELELELDYRLDLADRTDDNGVAQFEAIIRLVMRDARSPLMEQLTELVLFRTLRLLHAHPELVQRAGGAREMRRLGSDIAGDVEAARHRVNLFFSTLATDVAGRWCR
ncbi:GntR family transcriptional regulator [Leifsonia aquatica]|uniref:Transcriptional regulator, GntR family n=2 Tax=Leifsonia aquatica TaxID=144185 RepID=U2RNA6_LEIAQ|nr:GntR family transcriptional regulator [Leifsonia aquatica]ERK70044.1 transcriptional regulator, GntR family [Leifsonia aquatica ATCC 14665]MBB2968294.1 DNA-binding GntR family transcriptional regulator [Leifsonia aquatica]